MNQHPFDPSNAYPFDDNNGSAQRKPVSTPVPVTAASTEISSSEVSSSEALSLQAEPETEQAKQERLRATQQSFKRLYLILLAIGLSIGAVLGIGVAILLDRFNLSDPPSRCDRNSIGCFQRTPPKTIKHDDRF